MNSPFTTNDPDSVTRESSRKRKRSKLVTDDQNDLFLDKTRWRTESELRIYSSKLLEALPLVFRNTSSSSSSPANRSLIRRDVLVMANRVLAVTAKGKTRWSRAILKTSQLGVRLKKVKRQKIKVTCNRRLRRANVKKKKRANVKKKKRANVKKKKRAASPNLHDMMKKLGRAVPGCRKAPYINILDEAADYIAALEMQVRAMYVIGNLMWLGVL